MKEKLSFIFKLLVASALIVFVVKSGLLKLESLEHLFTVKVILVTVILSGLNSWIINWRWYWLLKTRGFPVTQWQTIQLYLIGLFFNYALPSSVGGDVVKGYYIVRDNESRRLEAALSVLLDRIIGVYAMLLIALVALALDFKMVSEHAELRFMATMTVGLFFAMSACFLVGFSKRVADFLQIPKLLSLHPRLHIFSRLFSAMQLYGQHRLAILIAVLVSILAQVITLVLFSFLGHEMGYDNVPMTAYWFCVPLGFLAMAAPIAPAGVGVGQVAFSFLLQLYAPGSGELGATSITVFQLAYLTWGLMGAVAYIRQKAPMKLQEC